MTRVLVVGVAVMDFVFYTDVFPTGGTKNRAHDAALVGGGCAANAAVAISRLGGEALLASRVGNDPIGQMILEDLKREGVDISATDVSGARSSYSSVLIDAEGERQIMNYRGRDLIETPDALASTSNTQAVMADTRWTEGALAAMTLAKKRGIPGVLDIESPAEPEPLIPASHLAFSEQGLASFYPHIPPDAAVERAASEFGGWVCVTLGPRGVFWCDARGSGQIPGFVVEVVDTLGAGDVWHGAFALRLAEGTNEAEAVRFANAVAALKCTKQGGRSGSPSRPEVEQFMKEAVTCS